MAKPKIELDLIAPDASRHVYPSLYRLEDQPDAVRAKLEQIKFMIIGTQKGGTTWLADILRHHPNGHVPEQKELHFFNMIKYYQRGPEWYADLYDPAPGETVMGEATPNYMLNVHTRQEENEGAIRHYDCAEAVKALLPQVKLMMSLRDPVARTISAHYHLLTRARFSPLKPFRDCLSDFGLMTLSMYDVQLEYWIRHFGEDRIKVLIFEDDIRPDDKKLATANEVFRFLDLPEMDDFAALYERTNDKESPALAWLRQIPGTNPIPYDWERAKRPGERFVNKLNRRLPKFVQDMADYKVSQADRDALKEFFEPHNRRLEGLLGRKLPW